MQNLFGMDMAALDAALKPLNLPKFRLRQIAAWLYQKGAQGFADMTDLPKPLRERLAATFAVRRGECQAELHSQDGATAKFLLSFDDKVAVETVYMRHDYGHSICISSQAGCNMGCAFCASTLNGLTRDLTAGEMLAQMLFVNDRLRRQNNENNDASHKINHLVIMGSGEPLLNYERVLEFVRLIHAPECLNFGYRHITISTSGIVPRIYDLAGENLPLTLSVSLHAPTDELRSKLMPVNRRFPIAELIKAGDYYGDRTGRRVTYEYILIDGINDSRAEAQNLVKLLRGRLANVNLIPANPVLERGTRRPKPGRVRAFAVYLQEQGIAATIRKEMGADIAAACGQLRNRFSEKL